LGGKLAYLMATRSDVDVSISYYGVGIQDLLTEMQNIKTPVLLHIAALDKFVPPAAQSEIIAESRKHELVSTHVYEGCDHAFARVGGQHFDAAAAEIALERSFTLLDKVLKA
jgi:carboxymethylenebutenolidase